MSNGWKWNTNPSYDQTSRTIDRMIDFLMEEPTRELIAVPEMWDVEVDLVDGSVAHILELSVGGFEDGQSFEWPGTLQGEAGEGGLPLDPENLLLMEPSPFAEIVDRLVAIAQEECPGMEILSGVHQLAA